MSVVEVVRFELGRLLRHRFPLGSRSPGRRENCLTHVTVAGVMVRTDVQHVSSSKVKDIAHPIIIPVKILSLVACDLDKSPDRIRSDPFALLDQVFGFLELFDCIADWDMDESLSGFVLGDVGVGDVSHCSIKLACIRLVFDFPIRFEIIPLFITFSSLKFESGCVA